MRRFLATLFIICITYSAAQCGVIYYDDPLAIGIGARPIGMGRAFVAVADDENAIFMNPAGLATQKKWSLSSMSTNFMDEYLYTMLSGVYPTDHGVYGIGYVSAKIGGILVTGGGQAEFANQALVVSYSRYVGDRLKQYLGSEEKIYAGANIKYYSKGFSGDVQASGAGLNIDLGLKYVQNKWLSYGLNFQNVFFGSKVSGDFEPEDMPFVTKLGMAFYLPDQNLTLALDKDLFFGRGSEVPWPMHFGVEWKAHKNLYLRTGFDQVAGASGGGDLSTNTTFGVGFEYDGFKTDISYMQNFAETNIASTILSISFYGDLFIEEKKKEAPKEVEKKEVLAPSVPYVTTKPLIEKVFINTPDKLITHRSEVPLQGTVEADIIEVTVDDRSVNTTINNVFNMNIPVTYGLNIKIVNVYDLNRNQAMINRTYYRYYLPIDVPVAEGEPKDLEHKVLYTLIRQYLSKDYTLDKTISKEILAMILVKAKKLNATPPEENMISKDINNIYWAAGYISAAKKAGFMTDELMGYFSPEKKVTREELVKIIFKTTGYTIQFPSWAQLNSEATYSDLIESFYNSGLADEDVDMLKETMGLSRQTI